MFGDIVETVNVLGTSQFIALLEVSNGILCRGLDVISNTVPK
jgi:hypothetical protein